MDKKSPIEIFSVFLRLGLTSVGGPVAHLGYFREEFVNRKKWLSDQAYADLVALCRTLPGPASSQVGLGIGLAKGGFLGGAAAWTGFTLPSALLLTLFGYGVLEAGSTLGGGWLTGLKVVAAAVVVQALWGMARSMCLDGLRATIALLSAIVALNLAGPMGQIAAILGGAILYSALTRSKEAIGDPGALNVTLPLPIAIFSLVLFAILLAGLPFVAAATGDPVLTAFDAFYRAGALVFGGGHVVLPLLQSELVDPGWVSGDNFLAGYGAAQAVPGPLFTFAAYLGTVLEGGISGWQGAFICLFAIFAPSFLLMIGILPFWSRLRQIPALGPALNGINAAVVGLLLAAFIGLIAPVAIATPVTTGIALLAFAALQFWKLPPWLIVIAAAITGFGLEQAGLLTA